MLVIGLSNSCQTKINKPMENAAANKAFILEMLHEKKQL